LQTSSIEKFSSSNTREEEYYEDLEEVEQEYYEDSEEVEEEYYEAELKVKEKEAAAELKCQEEEKRRLAYVPREVTIRQLFCLQNVCYKISSVMIHIMNTLPLDHNIWLDLS